MEEDAVKKRPTRRFYVLDPAMYTPRAKPRTTVEKSYSLFKSVLRLGGITILLLYPLFIIFMGLEYGLLGFWSSFIGSIAAIGLVIKKAGYGRNFQDAGNGGLLRGVLVLGVAFLMTLGFYEGFLVLKIWMAPAFVLVLLIGFLIYKIVKD